MSDIQKWEHMPPLKAEWGVFFKAAYNSGSGGTATNWNSSNRSNQTALWDSTKLQKHLKQGLVFSDCMWLDFLHFLQRLYTSQPSIKICPAPVSQYIVVPCRTAFQQKHSRDNLTGLALHFCWLGFLLKKHQSPKEMANQTAIESYSNNWDWTLNLIILFDQHKFRFFTKAIWFISFLILMLYHIYFQKGVRKKEIESLNLEILFSGWCSTLTLLRPFARHLVGKMTIQAAHVSSSRYAQPRIYTVLSTTRPNTNIAPVNRVSPKEISSSNHWFSGAFAVSFRECKISGFLIFGASFGASVRFRSNTDRGPHFIVTIPTSSSALAAAKIYIKKYHFATKTSTTGSETQITIQWVTHPGWLTGIPTFPGSCPTTGSQWIVSECEGYYKSLVKKIVLMIFPL